MPYVGYGSKVRQLVEVKGVKIVFLAFTYGFNYQKECLFFDEENADLPHPILPPSSRFYIKCLQQVVDDFKWAKEQNPDCILVYPHIGEQFRHSPDKTQLHWFGIFKKLGADVILGCHSHATQPMRFEDGAFCLYCPGNFINNYFPHDGDASAMVEVFLDKQTKKPIAAGIIPILAYSEHNELLQAHPMYNLSKNINLSWHDWNRLDKAHRTVTSSMLGIPLSIEQTQPEYIRWRDNSIWRYTYPSVALELDDLSKSKLDTFFNAASSVTFIGDSITAGTKNGGYGWFEPLTSSYANLNVLKYANGGGTSRTLSEIFMNDLQNLHSDIIVIAIGCNDIRYRDESICAMSADSFKNNIKSFIDILRINNPKSKIILISPWWSDDIYDKMV